VVASTGLSQRNTLLEKGSWLASKSDNLSESTQESQGGACVSPPLGTKRAKPLLDQ
jgi:hypothetical protein